MAPHHRQRRSYVFTARSRKTGLRWQQPNLSVTCKEETRKLLSLVTKRARIHTWMEHLDRTKRPGTRPKRQGSLTEPRGNGEDGGGATERRSSYEASSLPSHRRNRNLKTLYLHALDRRARD
ncbi:hypothetical protein Bca101_065390 [Brassica carinata]